MTSVVLIMLAAVLVALAIASVGTTTWLSVGALGCALGAVSQPWKSRAKR